MQIISELIQVAITSVVSIVVLFLLTKMIGNREMSQLNMFDYLNGITIGSIAAEMATAKDLDFLHPFLAMIVYALIVFSISILTNKFIGCRRFISGEPLILYQDGKLIESNFKKARMDINEFLTQCRNSGYFDVSKLQTAIMEENGKISFLPLASERPVTPGDMNLQVIQERLVINVVIDGKVLHDNLLITGNSEQWLKEQLAAQNAPDISRVFLACCNAGNQLSVFLKNEKI